VKRGGQMKERANKRRFTILIATTFSVLIFLNSSAADFKQPSTLKELLALSATGLEKVDLARMNLLRAEGLPGSED
jgi:hypothetical protein